MLRYFPLILACLILFTSPLFADEVSWESAIDSLKNNQYSEASEKLSQWIKQKAGEKVYSSEAHYNLFLAQIALESSGTAVAHLLRSIQIEKNPFKNLDSIGTLCDLQSRYGIKDGPCQSKYFTLSLLAGKNFLLILTCLFIWGLVFSSLYFFKNKKALYKSVALATVLIGGGNLLTYLATRSDYPTMVLTGNSKNISIYKTEESKEEEKLVDLAQGTLVEVSNEKKSSKRQITQPIVGWVNEDQLIAVDESLSNNPVIVLPNK